MPLLLKIEVPTKSGEFVIVALKVLLIMPPIALLTVPILIIAPLLVFIIIPPLLLFNIAKLSIRNSYPLLLLVIVP